MLSLITGRELERRTEWGIEFAGYSHNRYAESLSEFGAVITLQNAGGYLIKRKLPSSEYFDCIGCYPLFACRYPGALAADLHSLPEDIVSVTLVPDPWAGLDREELARSFDLIRPFKNHYVVDLDIPFDAYMHKHHRRYSRRALQQADVQLAEDPSLHADEWVALYQHSIVRHKIQGLRAFSHRALSIQLQVPGCHYFRGVIKGELQGALVCYLDRGVVYPHLISTTSEGQKAGLQYALLWVAMEAFRGRARWFLLGSTPGLTDRSSGSTGLSFFKSGWATGICQSHIYGRVHNRVEYRKLAKDVRPDHGFFPAYRSEL